MASLYWAGAGGNFGLLVAGIRLPAASGDCAEISAAAGGAEAAGSRADSGRKRAVHVASESKA